MLTVLLSLSLSCLQPLQSDEPDIDDTPIGLVLILANSTDATLLCPDKTVVVIEGNLAVEIPMLADAYLMLFALIYALEAAIHVI